MTRPDGPDNRQSIRRAGLSPQRLARVKRCPTPTRDDVPFTRRGDLTIRPPVLVHDRTCLSAIRHRSSRKEREGDGDRGPGWGSRGDFNQVLFHSPCAGGSRPDMRDRPQLAGILAGDIDHGPDGLIVSQSPSRSSSSSRFAAIPPTRFACFGEGRPNGACQSRLSLVAVTEIPSRSMTTASIPMLCRGS